MFSKGVILALVVALGAYSYVKFYGSVEQDSTVKNIVSAWQNLIGDPARKFRRVAVGVNSNVDLIVPAVELLKALDIAPGAKVDHDTVKSFSDLQEVFALFFTRGSAAERYFEDAALYQKVVKTAESLSSAESYIGGNAALMAYKVSSMFPEAQIQFVGPVGPALLKLLPRSIEIPEASKVTRDEVHLIMEYKVGDRWGDDVTPVATRFITSNDESNAKANMLEVFFNSLVSFNPDLILMSGLHMMEGLDPEDFNSRLQVLVAGLDGVASHIPIHMELASMAKDDYLQQILEQVVPRITSLGLNEQEIAFSSSVANGPHSELFTESSGQPEIYKISDMILWILKTYGYSNKRAESHLTRVHFHSLTYHIIGIIPSAWHNTESAVVAGARLAGRQACDVDSLSSKIADLKIPLKFKLFSEDQERIFDSNNPVVSWEREGFSFSFSPVLVCRHPEKTVGLGDSISSTGLMYSEFNPTFKTTVS